MSQFAIVGPLGQEKLHIRQYGNHEHKDFRLDSAAGIRYTSEQLFGKGYQLTTLDHESMILVQPDATPAPQSTFIIRQDSAEKLHITEWNPQFVEQRLDHESGHQYVAHLIQQGAYQLKSVVDGRMAFIKAETADDVVIWHDGGEWTHLYTYENGVFHYAQLEDAAGHQALLEKLDEGYTLFGSAGGYLYLHHSK